MHLVTFSELESNRGTNDPRITWRSCRALQQPQYTDQAALDAAINDLSSRPPLVFAGEVDALKDALAEAGRGNAFVLTGGDCAETFAESTAERIRAKIQTLLQMAIVLTYGASLPIVKMGRMAGQYTKPRSADTETRDGLTLPSYRGDAVNRFDFDAQARVADPQNLIEAYSRSASTLNLLRAFTRGGYADIRLAHLWNKGFTANPAYRKYERMTARIDRALRFMTAAGVDFETLRTVDMYISHEALLMEYESAMTRVDSRTENWYDTSAHFLWIGERTRNLDGAHVELLSRVANPVGVKLGPGTTTEDIAGLIDRLNPDGEPGRLSFITRMGADQIREKLPPLLEYVAADGRPVTWVCDPMHGNTFSAPSGLKTRSFETILDEVQGFFDAHNQVGTVPGGIHVELTGDDVTEVMGGGQNIDDAGLQRRYETLVDPRLNHQQSLELAFSVARMLELTRAGSRSNVIEHDRSAGF